MLGSVALALVLLGFDFDLGGGESTVGVKVVKANDDGVAKLPVMGYNSTCGRRSGSLGVADANA